MKILSDAIKVGVGMAIGGFAVAAYWVGKEYLEPGSIDEIVNRINDARDAKDLADLDKRFEKQMNEVEDNYEAESTHSGVFDDDDLDDSVDEEVEDTSEDDTSEDAADEEVTEDEEFDDSVDEEEDNKKEE